ncbi:MAG: hypothetical protein WD063_05205 [Pirellulales bacterium]
MWCKHCRQDTPSISSASRHGMCCGQCGVPLSGESEPLHPAEVGLDLDAPGTANRYEDWQLDQNVRSMQARFEPWRSHRPARRATNTPSGRPQWRSDAAHARVPPSHKPKRRIAAYRAGGRSPTFTNSALLMGLAACIGGVLVLGWSVVESRGDLWNIGLSANVAGGVVFLLGLVLQLERIWRNSRFAVHKLRQIDSHLQDLERTTSMLGVTHGSAAQAFYAHMSEQANPHLLLSDLKGQLDLLAMNLARR